MPYHLDFKALRLDYLQKRLLEEDLIPSLLPLREGLADKLARLGAAGVETLDELARSLGKATTLRALSDAAGVPSDYLKLLGRAIRGYTPKAALLKEYPGFPPTAIRELEREGITTSLALYGAALRPGDRGRLAKKTGIADETLSELLGLADLSRIQWVSPLFARLLYDSGFTGVRAVSRASAEDLCRRVDALNKRKKLFKGKIGPRDMGRLVYLASLLPHESRN
jgi:hypothetical protein